MVLMLNIYLIGKQNTCRAVFSDKHIEWFRINAAYY